MLIKQAPCKEMPNQRTASQLDLAKRNAKAGETCAHMALYKTRKRDSPHTKAPARERGIAWGACDKAASFGIANSFIVAPESQKRNL